MKLATYKDGSRDGQLVVVSRDLGQAHFATGTATRLQQVLDDWNFLSPQLNDLYVTLNHGKARHAFPFDPRQCMAPLPRAYRWAEGLADPSPAPTPADWAMVQGGSDDFLGPTDPAWFGAEAWGINVHAGLAVITGDVAMGASPDQALSGVRLLMLANRWCLRQLLDDEQARGRGPLQGLAAPAFSPVAITPDELGEAWRGGRVHGTLQAALNGRPLGPCETGAAMPAHFGQLIAHLTKTRQVRAGAVVGSGPLAKPDPARGGGLAFGDRVRVEMVGADGLSLFGAIDQTVVGPGMNLAEPDEATPAPSSASDAGAGPGGAPADTPDPGHDPA